MATFVRDNSVSSIQTLADPSAILWRYQDLGKLVRMLKSGALWFTRADKLRLDDPFEGSTTLGVRKSFELALRDVPNVEPFLSKMTEINRAWGRHVVVNCWHMGDEESIAMWRLYAAAGQGIAVRSSVDRLIRAFPEGRVFGASRNDDGSATVCNVEFGPVKYIDHYSEPAINPLAPAPIVAPYFQKRRSFEYEREFRALVFDVPIVGKELNLDGTAFPLGGVDVPADLDTLVEAIYVSPGAPAWYRETVEVVVRLFDKPYPVHQSRLDEDPVF